MNRSPREPILNVPAATRALLVTNIAVHLVRLLLPEAVDDRLVMTFAFVPARYSLPGGFGWPALVDPLTYQFLHAGWTHLGMNMVALLAFGSGVERRLGSGRTLAFALLCGVVSAAVHFLAYPVSTTPVIGASGAISGLFGGVLRWRARSGVGGPGLWPLIVLWIVITVISGLTGLPGSEGQSIAWVAHLGGFAAGLLLFGLFDRGDRAGRPW